MTVENAITQCAELEIGEICRLEYPADTVARRELLATLRTAIHFGILAGRTESRQRPGSRVNRDFLRLTPIENPPAVESRYFVTRADYRAWRKANAPKSAGPCFIPTWLNSQAEQGAAKRETEQQMHKRECQEIARKLWGENPYLTQADLKKHPKMQFYILAYRGKNTVSNWLSEVDPRRKEERRGRPKKIPA